MRIATPHRSYLLKKEAVDDDSDDRVALIEAQLKVARLEAELLELKNKAKSK